MQDILIILVCISAGMALGVWQRRRMRLLKAADAASLYAVYGMLFVLGARLGADETLLAQLPLLGTRAVCIAALCTLGSIACLFAFRRLFSGGAEGTSAPAAGAAGSEVSPLKGSVRILACFSLGILLGVSPFMPGWLNNAKLASYVLYLLVFAVGIGLGADLKAFRIVRDMHVKILAVPALIIAGTVLGSFCAAVLLPGLNGADALSVGLGLGYYSISSVLIENAGDSALASVALLANIAREVIAILFAPVFARYCGKIATVAAAGATAMDTTLPIIARFSGERCAVIAVFSGMTLTLLVPFLVTAALYLR